MILSRVIGARASRAAFMREITPAVLPSIGGCGRHDARDRSPPSGNHYGLAVGDGVEQSRQMGLGFWQASILRIYIVPHHKLVLRPIQHAWLTGDAQ